MGTLRPRCGGALPPHFGRASRNFTLNMQTINLDRLDLQDGHALLDLGCGHGYVHPAAAYFHKRCQAVGLDIGFEDVKITRAGFEAHPDLQPQTGATRRYDLSVGDALNLPFANDRFDRLVCSEVLEHIPDYQGALTEIWRVLKPGGKNRHFRAASLA